MYLLNKWALESINVLDKPLHTNFYTTFYLQFMTSLKCLNNFLNTKWFRPWFFWVLKVLALMHTVPLQSKTARNVLWCSMSNYGGKKESSRKASISALLTMPNPLTVWITINCGKFWKRWEYQTTWPASWKTYMQVRKQQLELDMEQQTGSK